MTNHPNRSKPFDWPGFLREFRSAHGLSQVALANALNISRRNVEDWERAINTPPNYLRLALERIAER